MSAGHTPNAGVDFGGAGVPADDRTEIGLFGFWVFLMSDAVIFALLFATYGVMASRTAGGPTPAGVYKMAPAFIETLVLLTSSFTFGMASVALKAEARVRLYGWMAVTVLLGGAFVVMELHDFTTMFGEGAYPMRSGSLSSFFALTPLHGLHVTVGIVWLIVMMVQIAVFDLDDRVKLNIQRLGLFWHFLDIVWIAIFSVVYLQGLIK